MSIKYTALTLVLTLTSLSAIGCGSSMRHIRHGGGGEIAFSSGLLPDMSSAHVAMLEHCGGRFRVIDEAEAMSLAMLEASPGKAGESVDEGGSRVHYVCERRTASAVEAP